jgi:hypothetical protein
MTTRILQKAIDIVDADRQKEYGDPCENAENQAVVASIILRRPVTALECNAINLAQKIVRMGRGDREDTLIDVAGYAEIRARLLDKAKPASTMSRVVITPCGAPTRDGEL